MVQEFEEQVQHEAGAVTVHATDAAALSSLSYNDPLAILGAAPYPEVPWWRRLSPSTVFVLLASAMAVFFLIHELSIAGKLGYPTDESWIDQVYARNFFHDIAFEFNPGERTAGPTSSFWVVFLSLGVGLFHDPIIAGKLLGTIFLFLTGYYSFRLLRTVGNDYGSSLLGGVLIVSASQLAWSELSGLESTLSTALVIGALWWYFASPHGWRRAIVGALFALASLTRPEATLIFLLVILYAWFTHVRDHRRGHFTPGFWGEAALTVAFYLLVITPVALTNLAIAGAIIPVTFYSGLGAESALRLIQHGEIAEFGRRLLVSLFGMQKVWTNVYLPENPLWLVTIVIAWFLRRKQSLIQRDLSDHLFSLSLLILLVFPFLRAFTLGTDDNFGMYGRSMHFLLPIYAVAGITSMRILVRCGLFRLYSPKKLVVWCGILLVGVGCLYLGLRSHASASYAIIPPVVDSLMLFFFTALLVFVGLRQAGILLWKAEIPLFVTEAERNAMTFQPGDSEEESRLSEPMIRALRAVLLVALAWNLMELPRAANDFAAGVREMNNEHLALAKVIATTTSPSDVIATNSIGAIGWIAERRVIDLNGHLTKQPTYNMRSLGRERGMMKTLAEERPQYLALFGHEDSIMVAAELRSGDLEQIRPNLFRLKNAVLP